MITSRWIVSCSVCGKTTAKIYEKGHSMITQDNMHLYTWFCLKKQSNLCTIIWHQHAIFLQKLKIGFRTKTKYTEKHNTWDELWHWYLTSVLCIHVYENKIGGNIDNYEKWVSGWGSCWGSNTQYTASAAILPLEEPI